MKLDEIFDQLSYGELSQMSIGGQPAGEINEDNWERIIPHINLGMTALFTRFNLKESRLTLELQEGQTLYPLTSYYAVNARRGAAVRYIIDTAADPFSDDLIKVEKVIADSDAVVYTEEQRTFPLNDAKHIYSVSTPTMQALRIPEDVLTQDAEVPEQYLSDTLTIVYRANHKKIVMGIGFFDPCRVTIELPETHLQALLFFVAARLQAPVGMTNEGAVSMNYMAKYENECQGLENKGVQVDLTQSNDRIRRNGWA